MKNTFFLLLVTFVLNSYCQNSAYVYRDSILMAYPTFKEKIVAYDSISKAYGKEINDMSRAINSKFSTLIQGYNPAENENIDALRERMNAEDLKKLDLLQKENEFLTTKQQGYEELVKSNFQENLVPIYKKINDAISSYAKSKKLNHVWIMEEMQSELAYINQKLNITNAIIKKVTK